MVKQVCWRKRSRLKRASDLCLCTVRVCLGSKRGAIITTLQRQMAHRGTLMLLTPVITTSELPSLKSRRKFVGRSSRFSGNSVHKPKQIRTTLEVIDLLISAEGPNLSPSHCVTAATSPPLQIYLTGRTLKDKLDRRVLLCCAVRITGWICH